MGEKRITILVIEDEEVLRASVADYLEDRDFRVLTAENGRVGLEAFIAQPESFDLIITDQTMPKMTGQELAEQVLADSSGNAHYHVLRLQ